MNQSGLGATIDMAVMYVCESGTSITMLVTSGKSSRKSVINIEAAVPAFIALLISFPSSAPSPCSATFSIPIVASTPGCHSELPAVCVAPISSVKLARPSTAIILFFSMLDEKLRRLYAGLEALKTGRGGDARIAKLLGLDSTTVARGRRELLDQDVEVEHVRRSGAGRRSMEKKRRK